MDFKCFFDTYGIVFTGEKVVIYSSFVIYDIDLDLHYYWYLILLLTKQLKPKMEQLIFCQLSYPVELLLSVINH